jgi:hypothetical protein
MILVFEKLGDILPFARQRKLVDTSLLPPDQAAAEIKGIVAKVKATAPRSNQRSEPSQMR